jgi:hypothetical protein
MTILTVNNSNLVLVTGSTSNVDEVNNNINIDGVVYSLSGVTAFQVDSLPADYEPQKYCYTTTASFTVSPNYVAPVVVITMEQLQANQLIVMGALADMYVAIAALTPTTGGAS